MVAVNNYAVQFGGVINAIGAGSSIRIGTGMTAIGNGAGRSGGGVVWVGQGATVDLGPNAFLSNNFVDTVTSSDANGGAFYVGSANLIIGANLTATNNSAIGGQGGGFLYAAQLTPLPRANVSIAGPALLLGNAAKQGGAILADAGSNLFLADNISFVANRAFGGDGGGILIKSSNVTLGSINFESNVCTRSGGAMYITLSGGGRVGMLGEAIFRNNSAVNNGGGVLLIASNLSIPQNSLFEGNRAVGPNSPPYGGAIHVSGNSNLVIGRSVEWGQLVVGSCCGSLQTVAPPLVLIKSPLPSSSSLLPLCENSVFTIRTPAPNGPFGGGASAMLKC